MQTSNLTRFLYHYFAQKIQFKNLQKNYTKPAGLDLDKLVKLCISLLYFLFINLSAPIYFFRVITLWFSFKLYTLNNFNIKYSRVNVGIETRK